MGRGSSNGEEWEFWKREAAKQELKAGDRWYEALSKGKWEAGQKGNIGSGDSLQPSQAEAN